MGYGKILAGLFDDVAKSAGVLAEDVARAVEKTGSAEIKAVIGSKTAWEKTAGVLTFQGREIGAILHDIKLGNIKAIFPKQALSAELIEGASKEMRAIAPEGVISDIAIKTNNILTKDVEVSALNTNLKAVTDVTKVDAKIAENVVRKFKITNGTLKTILYGTIAIGAVVGGVFVLQAIQKSIDKMSGCYVVTKNTNGSFSKCKLLTSSCKNKNTDPSIEICGANITSLIYYSPYMVAAYAIKNPTDTIFAKLTLSKPLASQTIDTLLKEDAYQTFYNQNRKDFPSKINIDPCKGTDGTALVTPCNYCDSTTNRNSITFRDNDLPVDKTISCLTDFSAFDWLGDHFTYYSNNFIDGITSKLGKIFNTKILLVIGVVAVVIFAIFIMKK